MNEWPGGTAAGAVQAPAPVRALHWLRRVMELSSARRERLLPMEGLRGLAVLLVFMQHYSQQAHLHFALDPVSASVFGAFRWFGNLGVELFFVLSGYLIYGVLIRGGAGFGAFMRRRLQRLYPAFLAAFLVFLAIHLASGSGKVPPGLAGIGYIAANLLFLPGLAPITPLVAVDWSLSYEVGFYLLIGALVPLLALRRRRRAGRLLVVAALALGLTAAALALPPGGAGWQVPLRALTFCIGMLLYEAQESRWPPVPSAIGLGLVPLSLLAFSNAVLPPVAFQWVQTLVFGALCSACLASGSAAGRLLAWTPLRWLGNMSYSFYLFQGFALLSAFLVIPHLGLTGALWAWLLLPVVFAAAVLTCFPLYYFIELPFSLRPRKR